MSKTSLFDDALAAEGVTGKLADLARSIYTQESGGGKNTSTSNRGARGGMQILPATFARVADKGWNIDDPLDNARAGIRYLKKLDKQSGGVPELTAAGYYGGEGGLEKARQGVAVSDPANPKAPNTLQYGQQVAARLGKGSASGTPTASAGAPPMAPSPVAAFAPPAQEMPGVSPEIWAKLAQQINPTAQQPLEPDQVDAWTAFLKNMPQAKQAVSVEDLNYLAPASVSAPQLMAAAPVSPDFRAFTGWRGLA